MNATMFKMAKSLHEVSDYAVREEMELLEWNSGPEILSSSNSKVGRLGQHCHKVLMVGQGVEQEQALTFVLRMMGYVVSTEKVRSVIIFTMDVARRRYTSWKLDVGCMTRHVLLFGSVW